MASGAPAAAAAVEPALAPVSGDALIDGAELSNAEGAALSDHDGDAAITKTMQPRLLLLGDGTIDTFANEDVPNPPAVSFVEDIGDRPSQPYMG
jgi:hypothetical protein